MENKIKAIQYIASLWGEIATTAVEHKMSKEFYDALAGKGYIVYKPTPYSMDVYAIKGGLKFIVSSYVSYGLMGFNNLNENDNWHYDMSSIYRTIDHLLSFGFKCEYERSNEMSALIAQLRKEYNETASLVNGRGLGEIGDFLRSKGYFVGYNGFSVCNFSKGHIIYSATTTCGKWELRKRIELFRKGDATTKSINIDSKDDSAHTLDNLEIMLGTNTELGYRVTEKDRLSRYNRFKVGIETPRTYEPLRVFNNFDDAKKYAYDKAVELAKNVSGSNRQWARTNPTDKSDTYDKLAHYVFYSYQGYEHAVEIEGWTENE